MCVPQNASYEQVVKWVYDVWNLVAEDDLIIKGFGQCGYINFNGDYNKLHSRPSCEPRSSYWYHFVVVDDNEDGAETITDDVAVVEISPEESDNDIEIE